ncbi:MAG: TolC family protein [Oligoflexia bacterium]|nr:TolC family protein [Oligoflexia bacterium]
MKIVLLLMFTIASLNCQAQTTSSPSSLTLNVARIEALNSNPEFKRSKITLEEYPFKKDSMLSAHLPKFSLSTNHYFYNRFQYIRFGASNMPATYPYSTLSLDASFLLFDGFGIISNYKSTIIEEDASKLKHRRLQVQIEREIELRFYQALAAKQLAEVANMNILSLQDHLKEAKNRERIGVGTNYEVLRVEVQLEDAKSEKLASDDQIETSRLKLAQIMGLENDSRILIGELPIPDLNFLSEININKSRSDIEAQRRIIDQTRQAIITANSGWYPRISLIANNQWYNNRDRSYSTDQFDRSHAIGINATWNFFEGGDTNAKSALAALKVIEQENILQTMLLQNSYDLIFWKKRYKLAYSQYHARLRSISKAEESVRLAKVGIRNGTRTNSELLDAELDLFRARANLIKSKLDAIEASFNLKLLKE